MQTFDFSMFLVCWACSECIATSRYAGRKLIALIQWLTFNGVKVLHFFLALATGKILFNQAMLGYTQFIHGCYCFWASKVTCQCILSGICMMLRDRQRQAVMNSWPRLSNLNAICKKFSLVDRGNYSNVWGGILELSHMILHMIVIHYKVLIYVYTRLICSNWEFHSVALLWVKQPSKAHSRRQSNCVCRTTSWSLVSWEPLHTGAGLLKNGSLNK